MNVHYKAEIDYRYGEQTNGFQWEEGKGERDKTRAQEVQTIMYKTIKLQGSTE